MIWNFATSLPSLSFTPTQVKPFTSSLGCIRCVYHEGGAGEGGGGKWAEDFERESENSF